MLDNCATPLMMLDHLFLSRLQYLIVKKRKQIKLTEIILLTEGKVHVIHVHFTTDVLPSYYCP